MIRALRKRHLRSFLALAIVLPILLALSLVVRESGPALAKLPAELEPSEPALGRVLWERAGLFGELPIVARLGAVGDALELELEAREPLQVPDLLVYWSASAAMIGAADALPDDARLLGDLGRGRGIFALPPGASAGGTVALYSLAHAETIASARVSP